MKVFGTTMVLVLAVMLAGCVSPANLMQVAGSGNPVTVDQDLAGFTKVRAATAFEVTIKQGPDYRVVITVDDNIKPYLDVRVDGDTLNISLKPNTVLGVGSNRLQADVTMPALEALEVSGASRADLSGFESKADLSLRASGASRIQGTITAGDVTADLSGASQLGLKGQGGDLKLDASGASNANLSDFPVGDADVQLSGASRAQVNMEGTLDADVSGASGLKYAGEVRLGNVETSGASNVEMQ